MLNNNSIKTVSDSKSEDGRLNGLNRVIEVIDLQFDFRLLPFVFRPISVAPIIWAQNTASV